ncbi:MAG: TonB-dependent receptor [Candidatus Eisenbacteria bacterium]|nr:TonB-dependent receptor [Candidatus Eisenbacteria bacterium]
MTENRIFLVPVFLLVMLSLCGSVTSEAEESGRAIAGEELLFRGVKVVAASKYEQSLTDAPSSVTIITDSDIRNYGCQTLADVLRDVAGFDAIYDRNYEYVGVRGFARLGDYSTRILLLMNGHVMNDNWIGSNLIGTDSGIDLDLVKRIEIVRGPGSALYGTNAFFAVVNVITYGVEDLQGLKLSNETGSFGMKKGILIGGKNFGNGLRAIGSLSLMDTKGDDLYFEEYDGLVGDGITRGADYDRSKSFLGQISYGEVSIFAKLSSRTKGVPTGSYETTFGDDRTRTIDGRNFVEMNVVHPISADKGISGKLYYDNMVYKGLWIYADEPGHYFSEEGAWGDWIGVESNYTWDIARGNRLTLGGEYQRHRLKTALNYLDQDRRRVDGLPDGRYSYSFWALCLQQELRLRGNLNITVGCHYDDYPVFGGVADPRAAFIYKPFRQSTVKLLYGEAFRAPSIYEKYYTDEMTQIGNDGLDPEKVRTWEGIWEQWIGKSVNGQLSLYHNSIYHLINQVMTPDSMLQYQNSSAIVSQGIELSLRWRFGNGWEGFASSALQNSKDREADEKLANVPVAMATAGIVIPIHGDKLKISLKENYSDKRKGKRPDIDIDPYYITTVGILSRGMVRNLELSLTCHNLFDQEYYNAAGDEHLGDKIRQDGRVLRFKLSYLLK